MEKREEEKKKKQQGSELEEGLLTEDQQEPEQQEANNEEEKAENPEKPNETRSFIGGTGFSFDITDFFPAKTIGVDEMLEKMGTRSNLQEAVPVYVAWVILFYSICNGAIIPGWIMNIKATKYLRIAWRFFMQSFIMIPFAMYERRTGSEETRAKYTFAHVFKPANFKKLYFASFAQSFWFTSILFSFEYTFVSHALVLGALMNFFLSVTRAFQGQKNHSYEKGGQVLVVMGSLMIMLDSLLLVPAEMPEHHWDFVNTMYLQREWWQRLFGDVVAFATSYVYSVFNTWNKDLKNYYPSFLSMSLWFMLNFFNMGLSAFFFTGADLLSINNFWGFFGLFSQEHIASFMYMSIVLMAGMLVTSLLIKELFPDVVPALAGVFESVLSVIFVWLAGVQMLPGPVACIGFVFVMPGMLLIIVGHNELMSENIQAEKQKRKEIELRTKIELEIEGKYKRLYAIKERPEDEEDKEA